MARYQVFPIMRPLHYRGKFLALGLGMRLASSYSKTSDSGPSEIGTQYNKPLYKGRFSRSQIIGLSMVLIHFELPRRGQPLYIGQKT